MLSNKTYKQMKKHADKATKELDKLDELNAGNGHDNTLQIIFTIIDSCLEELHAILKSRESNDEK